MWVIEFYSDYRGKEQALTAQCCTLHTMKHLRGENTNAVMWRMIPQYHTPIVFNKSFCDVSHVTLT